MADNNEQDPSAVPPINVAAAGEPIPADEGWELLSVDASEVESETTSLKSSVLNFEIENGRRYHGYQQGAYAFPNDEKELDRMDLEHHIFGMLLGGLYLCPLRSPQKILDLGTGTGIWAIEIADEFTSAQVTGTDLSPTQPQLVPPNCEFLVDDFEQEWTWQANSFDLIHGRLLLASVKNYPQLFRRAFTAIKPGGFLEIHDIDPSSYCNDETLTSESSSMQWGELFKEGCAKVGAKILPLEEYKPLMEEAGFVDVQELVLVRPHNSWPKDKWLKRIGMYTLLNHLNGLHAFTVGIFTRVLGWKPEEVEVFCAKCKTEWTSVKLHGYQKVIAIYGRKPESN